MDRGKCAIPEERITKLMTGVRNFVIEKDGARVSRASGSFCPSAFGCGSTSVIPNAEMETTAMSGERLYVLKRFTDHVQIYATETELTYEQYLKTLRKNKMLKGRNEFGRYGSPGECFFKEQLMMMLVVKLLLEKKLRRLWEIDSTCMASKPQTKC